MKNQLFRFILVAIANTVSFIIVIVLLKHIGFGDVIANFFGYVVAIIQSFVLNRKWTFLHDGKISTSIVIYLIIIFFAYIMNLLVLLYALHGLKLESYLSHGFGAVAYGAVAFIGMRNFVFKKYENNYSSKSYIDN
jgi:putative flippase GtrA